MDAKDVLKLLQFYQHNFLNDLQVIQAYINMEQPESALDKINSYAKISHENKKIIQLNAANFGLWLMKSNMLYNNICFEYRIQTKRSVHSLDKTIMEICQQIAEELNKFSDKEELYQVLIEMADSSTSEILLSLTINGKLTRQKDFIKAIKNQNNLFIKTELEKVITVNFTYSI